MNLSWADFYARLTATPEVDGLVSIGSASRDDLGPASDYDLVIIMRQPQVPLRVGLAQIEGRLADIIFVDVMEVARLLGEATPPHPAQWSDAQLLRWLRDGKIGLDRSGLLHRAKAQAEATSDPGPGAHELYSAWFSIHYNLQQTQRMRRSNDPAYATAVDLRLLFSLHDLWRYYFVIRQLAVHGEKAQVQYLNAHDPAYLRTFQDCLTQIDQHAKLELYTQLAAQTLAPLGGQWTDHETAILPNPDEAWEANTIDRALSFWQRLVQPPEA